jgi:hypothetical protein
MRDSIGNRTIMNGTIMNGTIMNGTIMNGTTMNANATTSFIDMLVDSFGAATDQEMRNTRNQLLQFKTTYLQLMNMSLDLSILLITNATIMQVCNKQ